MEMVTTYDVFKAPVGSTLSYWKSDGSGVVWTKKASDGASYWEHTSGCRSRRRHSDSVLRLAVAESVSHSTITLITTHTYTAQGQRHTAALMTRHDDGTPYEIGRFVNYDLAQCISVTHNLVNPTEPEQWVHSL